MTYNPDEHEIVSCPFCENPLIYHPTIGENYRTARCHGMKKKEDGSISDRQKCGYEIIFKDGEIVSEDWNGKRERIEQIKEVFNGKEANMAFDLSGYKPEVVKDNYFEVMTGKNNICVVNSAKIEEVEAGERDGREYDAYTRLRYELEVISEKFKKRKVWKSYNLDSTQKTGKKEKTPIEKLADAFFTIGLEFSDMATLESAIEKFAEMTLVVSFSKFTPKGEKEPRQLHTIVSVAPESCEEGGGEDKKEEVAKF